MYFFIGQIIFASILTIVSIYLIYLLKKAAKNETQVFQMPMVTQSIMKQSMSKSVSFKKPVGQEMKSSIKFTQFKMMSTEQEDLESEQRDRSNIRPRNSKDIVGSAAYLKEIMKQQKLKRTLSTKMKAEDSPNSTQQQIEQALANKTESEPPCPSPDKYKRPSNPSVVQLMQTDRDAASDFFGPKPSQPNSRLKFRAVFLLLRFSIEQSMNLWLYNLGLSEVTIIAIALVAGFVFRILEQITFSWLIITIILLVQTFGIITTIIQQQIGGVEAIPTYCALISFGIEIVISFTGYILMKKTDNS